MSISLSSLLPVLRPPLAALIADSAWRRVGSLVRSMPTAWSSGCFEVRLAPGEERVDFLVFAPPHTDRKAFASTFAERRYPPSTERVRPLLAEWVGPGAPLHDGSPALYLEYDLPDGRPSPPFVIFGGYDSASSLTPGELRRLAMHSRRLLSLDDSPAAAVERCAKALPQHGAIRFFASPWPARLTPDLRLTALLSCDEMRS